MSTPQLLPLTADEIRGNWATLLLPINPDDTINYAKLADEIDTLISMHVNGIYSNGTAGEFYNQTEDEFDRVNQLLAEKCHAAHMPFQVGCSHMSPVISLERVKRSLALHPGAIQVILPDWYPPTMEEVIHFLRVIGEAAAPAGLILYNPPHAKKILTPEEYAQILTADVPVVGCKVAGGDEQWYAAMKKCAPGLALFVPGHTLATGYKRGAHGAYSNMACLHPGMAQTWYHLMLSDLDAALEIEGRIQLFIRLHILPFMQVGGYSGQAVDKLLAALVGWADIGTRLRWPYRWIDQQEVRTVRRACRDLLPEFFTWTAQSNG